MTMADLDIDFINRLKTYARWNISFLNPISLAAAGLRYTGTGDVVECDYCTVQLHDWKAGDDPVSEHLFWRPSCMHNAKLTKPPPLSVDTSSPKVDSDKPVHSRMRHHKERFNSFHLWPGADLYRPNELARAGFFLDDRHVQCFECGVRVVYSKVPTTTSAWKFHKELNDNCPWAYSYELSWSPDVEVG